MTTPKKKGTPKVSQKRKRNAKLPEKAFENARNAEAEAFARAVNVPVDRLSHPLMFEGFNGRNILDADVQATERAIICITLPDGRTLHDERCLGAQHAPPPDTSAYPWPLKWAWKFDDWFSRIARRLA